MSFHEDMADREFALNVGRENPDRPWILSDRDVWYANPFYQGPATTHPEYEEGEWADPPKPRSPFSWGDVSDEEIPF